MCLPHLWFSQQITAVCEGSGEVLSLSISESWGQQESEASQQKRKKIRVLNRKKKQKGQEEYNVLYKDEEYERKKKNDLMHPD